VAELPHILARAFEGTSIQLNLVTIAIIAVIHFLSFAISCSHFGLVGSVQTLLGGLQSFHLFNFSVGRIFRADALQHL